jgi:hypothetical protein
MARGNFWSDPGSFFYSEAEVVIHGLGAAINLAVDLALSIVKRSLGDLVASPTTTTEPLIDDFEPLSPVRRINNPYTIPTNYKIGIAGIYTSAVQLCHSHQNF